MLTAVFDDRFTEFAVRYSFKLFIVSSVAIHNIIQSYITYTIADFPYTYRTSICTVTKIVCYKVKTDNILVSVKMLDNILLSINYNVSAMCRPI